MSESEGATGGTPDPQGEPNTNPGNDTPPDSGEDVAALKAALAKERAAARDGRKAATERDRLQAELDKFREANATESERALKQARDEAAKEARADEFGKWSKRIVTAEVTAAAAGKLADPRDAVRLLDLGEFDIGDDGEVDRKKVDAAIAQLLTDKPYLAAGSTKPPEFDGGARNTAPTSDMNSLIRRAAGRTT